MEKTVNILTWVMFLLFFVLMILSLFIYIPTKVRLIITWIEIPLFVAIAFMKRRSVEPERFKKIMIYATILLLGTIGLTCVYAIR